MNQKMRSSVDTETSWAEPGTHSQHTPWLLRLVSFGMAAASLAVGWIMPINDDDAFYLHTWWLYGRGYVAHRDFLGTPPGLWLLLAPAAWLPWTPSGFITFGRALVACTFGLSFYLVGRLVRAYRWEAVLLAAMALPIMLRTEWFTFRRAFFEILLILWQLVLLEALPRSRRPAWIGFWVGAAGGLMCTISQRGLFYLPMALAVFVWFLWGQWAKLRSVLVGWVVGGLIAAAPTIAYIAVHNLWIEQYQWYVVFPSTIDAHYIGAKELVRILVYGMMVLISVGGLLLDRRIPRQSKQLLAFAAVVIFLITSINFTHYTRAVVFVLIAGLGLSIPRSILDRWAGGRWENRIGLGLAAAVLLALAIFDSLTSECPIAQWPAQWRVRTAQNQVLDWLAQVSQQEPVLAIDPYHPMVVPNTTFLRGFCPYITWIHNPMFRDRFADSARQLLHSRPPLIAATPWPDWTQGRNLIQWFQHNGIGDPAAWKQVREMIRQEYVQISFPAIRSGRFPAIGELHYGDTFWIRRDRFQAYPPPDIPHHVRQPEFSTTKAD